MKAVRAPRSRRAIRVLVVDGASGAMHVAKADDLPSLFEPGDLLVVNDAATLPASLRGTMGAGESIELRLVGALDDRRFRVALLGSGDYRTPTEDRPAPPDVRTGDRLALGARLVADVVAVDSERIVDVELGIVDRPDAALGEVWAELYRVGNPVQYAHVPEPLSLWDVQNVYAARPWAVEMPSAGRAIGIDTLLALRRRGVAVATVTHAAGLSSIGDASLDSRLPFPERYEVTERTWEAIASARRRGGRVVAIGTSVARALEGGVRNGRTSGVTDLRIGRGMRRAIVDAVLTGVHEADTSHFALLGAFARAEVLERALATAEREGLLGHELGDACLVWGEPRDKLTPHEGSATRGKVSRVEDPPRGRPSYR